MGKQELTEEELIKCFGAHVGNEVVIGFGDICSLHIIQCKDGNMCWAPPDNYRLRLTPLCELTKEHAGFIYEMVIGEPIGGDDYIVTKSDTEINIESIYNIDKEDKTNVFVPYTLDIYYSEDGCVNDVNGDRIRRIVDQLREWGYDCGYKHVDSLIKSGYAIKK